MAGHVVHAAAERLQVLLLTNGLIRRKRSLRPGLSASAAFLYLLHLDQVLNN